MKTRILTLAFLMAYTFSFSQVDMLMGKQKEILLFGPENVNRILPEQKEHYIYQYTLIAEDIMNDIHDAETELVVLTSSSASAKGNKMEKRKAKSIIRLQKNLVVVEHYIELWTALPETTSAEMDRFYQSYDANICYKLDTRSGTISSDDIELVEFTSATNYREVIPVRHVKSGGEWVRKKKSPNCYSQNPDDCYIVCFEKGSEKPLITLNQGNIETNYEGCPKEFLMATDKTHCYKEIELETDNTSDLPMTQLVNIKNGTAILDIYEWTTITCE